MLQPADEELTMRDSVLGTTLALLLDEEAFAAALQARLPSVTISSVRAVYVRYKPHTNCLVSYRVVIDGNELDVYAKGYESGELVKALSGPEDAVFALGGGAFSLCDTAVVVCFFPYDRELRALKRLHPYESNFREKLLRRLLPNHRHLCKGQIQTLRYKPERRFAAHLSDSSDAALIKIYNSREFHTASRATSFHSDESLRIAGLLGRSDRHHILAFEWLAGRSLEASLDHSNASLYLELTGEALARLHLQSLAELRQQRRMDGALAEIANGLEALIPLEASNARFLIREINRRLVNTTARKCSVHGDFYANQVLMTDEGVAVLDLDEAACGDPTSDLGNFLAHLERRALFGGMNTSQVEAARRALLAGYERKSERTVSRDVLTIHTAATLMQLTHDPFRYRQSDWPARTSAILERVRELLNCGSNKQVRKPSPASPRVSSNQPTTDALNGAIDSAMPFLQDALHPQRALVKLRECLRKYANAKHIDLLGIRVIRHKPRRRCVVEYDISLQSASGNEQLLTFVGKARARGLDESGARHLFALRRAGFDDYSSDGISVPEPFGVIPEFQMWLQRKVTGVPAVTLLTGKQDLHLAEQIGRAIHKLQHAGVIPDRQHTLKNELDTLRRCLAIVSASKPEWHVRLQRIMAACERLAKTLAHDFVVPAHRDFYHDQLVIQGERLYLLDLDLFALAPNALDAGNFIAHLTELSLRSTGHANALADCERAVEEGLIRSNSDVSRAAVGAFSNLTLVRHIYISMLFVDRREFTENILELCERRLNVSRHTSGTKLPALPPEEGIRHVITTS
jgi:thiamine kinase-like enzyme